MPKYLAGTSGMGRGKGRGRRVEEEEVEDERVKRGQIFVWQAWMA